MNKTSIYLVILASLMLSLNFSCSNSKPQSDENDLIPQENKISKEVAIKSENLPKPILDSMDESIHKSISWKDQLGENFLIISTAEEENIEQESNSEFLFVKHFILESDGKASLLWDTKDFVKDCQFDNMLRFMDESLKITDVNQNGIAESTYMYTLGCVSDVSPFPLKLILHEGKEKLAIRGEVVIDIIEDIEESKYKVDVSEFKNEDTSIIEFAKTHWELFKTVKY